jgi:ABC-2 type transport system ATP-binding protein
MESGIKVDKLRKVFRDFTALDGISFEIGEGELFGILGPDGSGKTTLCRIIAGLMAPTSGSVLVGEFDAARQKEQMKLFTGYMPHNYGLYGDLTVEENVNFYADIFQVPAKARKERMDRVLSLTGLASFTRRRSAFLSGGMKQKLQLSCALIHTPRYLILDEPTYGVDPVSRREFWKLLLELLKDGLTIMLSTSYMDEAQRCHRVALLYGGRILRQGNPDEVVRGVPGTMVEIFAGDATASARKLKALPWVRNVTTYGDRIHLLARDRLDESQVSLHLKGAGIPVSHMQEISPSLEDSFIFLVEEAEKAG